MYGRMGADEKDVGYISTLHNLAFSSQAAGDLRRAIPLYQDVIRLWKQAVGPKHIAFATSMLNLAVAHHELGEHKEALKRGKEALKLFEALDADTAGALGVVGAAQVGVGDSAAAIAAFERRVEVRRAVADAAGEGSPEQLTLLHDLEELSQLRLSLQYELQAADDAGDVDDAFAEKLIVEVSEAAKLRKGLLLRAEDDEQRTAAWANVMVQLLHPDGILLRPAALPPGEEAQPLLLDDGGESPNEAMDSATAAAAAAASVAATAGAANPHEEL